MDHIGGPHQRKMQRAMTAISSADARVVTLKMADRLHNMRTLRFLPPDKQRRKAREALDLYGPTARQFGLETVGSELETLAFASLTRARPAFSSGHRTIVALDIEGSTSRSDPVKSELRTMLYELFDAALRSAGIYPRHRAPFIDRGDGLLALIRPVDQAPKTLLLSQVFPTLHRLLSSYNASIPADRSQRRLRVRAVMHAGEVHHDANGCFGEALDIAFRLLDAPRAKQALKAMDEPIMLVVSGHVYQSVIRHGHDGIDPGAFDHLVTRAVAGHRYLGWVRSASTPDGLVGGTRPGGIR
jgi:class 3 adenylate cyclase